MVLEKLLGGADLFAAGVAPRSIDALPDSLIEGSLVGIGTQSVQGAVRAIGRLTRCSVALKASKDGKAAEVLHVEGDTLWEQGSKVKAQPRAFQVESTENDEEDRMVGTSALASGAAAHADPSTSVSALDEKTVKAALDQADVDLILHEALLYAISQLLAKQSGAFPLSSSKFLDTYVLPSRWASSAEHEVSIKKSSHKNASAFLKQAKKDGLITTKEGKNGELSIISVNTSHAE